MKISKILFTVGTFLLLAIIISACSTQVQIQESKSIVTKEILGINHAHPANDCTNSITHKHPLPAKDHKHSYSCKGKAPKSANSHTHPVNRCTKSTTHNHLNGKRIHIHKYICQANSKNRSNAHTHPANRVTRSKRHVHPGGNKAHKHHYSR